MKIIIIQIGKIGDMVLTTPMFRAIKEKYPDYQLHVLTSIKASSILINNPFLDKIYIYQKGLPLVSLLIKLYNEKYDVWVDPKDHYSSEGTLLAKLSNAIQKIGYNTKGRTVFDISLPSNEKNISLHAIDRNIQALKDLGICKSQNIKPDIYINDELKEKIFLKFDDSRRSIVVINISAGNKNRKWDLEKWIEVVEYFEPNLHQVVLISDPSDINYANLIFKRCPYIEIINTPSIEYACAVIYFANVVITSDTAIVHIASAFDKPIVALYPRNEWNFAKFKPLSSKQVVVFPMDNKQISDIKASEVINAILELKHK